MFWLPSWFGVLAKAPAFPLVDGTLLFIVVTVGGILAAVWVYFDARAREIDNPVLWAAVVAFLFLLYAVPGLIALIVYLFLRSESQPESDSR